MRTKWTIVGVSIILLGVPLGLWQCTDIGLEYENATVHLNSTFAVTGQYDEVVFRPSDHHVFVYTAGRRHSRVTSAHGFGDRLLIEFTGAPERDSGRCQVIKAYSSRIGYMQPDYAIRSPEDVWAKIEACGKHFHVEAAIRRTVPLDSEFPSNRWDLLMISRRKVESNKPDAGDGN